MKTIYKEKYQKIIQYLISTRKKKGITQQQIANKLDKPQSYIAKIERCERKLDILEFIELCEAMNTSPITILQEFVN
ncbi:helix-turn-helix transcriptional regulator [Pasteurella skyensis]|uniref:Helix-turn-helix transcriptional regulator n=1 Tax=Phocoenobacter skyensis TaxID=97481 RepID=A0AAJ6NB21_9PAST|nr:helix-turn-helix transcriptional regulator [Pasteurella skyensis]MDP8163294.1 helix-turn-helix transcriptional regulator [Pasteurella skyensis]MDP8173495.1 helix-turn-helix transcriptional regulator [Pasteurella skyensis]MDP8177276.1 helix-turn-helix transcriptional regulator [Pasteurella skyensis]MDP8179776.1 helix-turn-helix transcriptional regulator [Pasteurella skyensis]MDP8183890.1 helix-turn-helix transcriptional regulator [Pasteurella skyensis]